MRLKITKSKNSESLYIIKSYRNSGKNTSKIISKLGTMNDLLPLHDYSRENVITWANEIAANLTQKGKEDSEEVTINLSQSRMLTKNQRLVFNGGYLFLQDIFYDLQLDLICESIAERHSLEFNFTDVLAKLIYAKVLDKSPKMSSFDYSKSFVEQPDFNQQSLQQVLDIIEQEYDFIQEELYKTSPKAIERNFGVLCYDRQNFVFESKKIKIKDGNGIPKECEPCTVVPLGLFLDGNGIPLTFVVYPGEKSRHKNLNSLDKKIIRDFNQARHIICADASSPNPRNQKLTDLSVQSYIFFQPLSQLDPNLKEWALNPKGWQLNDITKTYNLGEIDDESNFNLVFWLFATKCG